MKLFEKTLLLLTLTALLFLLPACAQTAPAAPGETDMPAAAGEAGEAPDAAPTDAPKTPDYGTVGTFKTQDTAGNEVTNAVFAEADVTMLNVWATFCGYCIEEMPTLTKLNGEFADRGFQILGLVGDVGDGKGGFTDGDRAESQTIMDKAGAEFPTLMPSLELIRSVLNQVPGYPTTFFVDSEGKLLGEPVVGARGENSWREIIEAYLEIAPKRAAQE